MSLKHIQQRREPITFGSNLNVPFKDTYINGDLDIQGAINGTSSQGQNTNNTWTGTNTYSVYRPVSSVSAVGLQDGINKTFLDAEITNEGIINKGATWTGTNDFAYPIVMATPANVPIYIPPVNATDAVCGKYIGDSWNAKNSSYTTTNNTWTGSNTFSILPLVQEPVANTDVASLNYCNTAIANTLQGSTGTLTSTIALTAQSWANTAIAVSVQIIGGGGGSTSAVGTCVCSSAGVSGGSGSQASILILTSTIAEVGTGANRATYDLIVGGGGKAGSGCGTNAFSGGGGSTNLYTTPVAGLGYNPLQINILRANGGGGANVYCGEPANTAGGTYSAINPLVVSPLSSSNGRGGSQCAGSIPQYYGINTLGWGARGASCANGVAGNAGGYGITSFFG